jgi:hypothetical protein
MSRNGSLALKKLIISYSPSHGAPNVRQFLATHLPLFKSKYPSVAIDIRPRFWPENAITGVYQDGSEHALKTKDLSSMGIFVRCNRLVNTANDFDLPFNAAHVHLNRRSVQGTWNPWLWNGEVKGKTRVESPKWDRKLSEGEWDFFVDRYATQMQLEAEAVEAKVAAKTALSKQNTEEVRRRWMEHVTPRMQTDLEQNISDVKQDYKRKGKKLSPVTDAEYKLFAVPHMTTMGQDAVHAMRRHEKDQMETWWLKRKEQLKAPE